MIDLWPQWLRPLWLLAVPLLGWLLYKLWHRRKRAGRWQMILPPAFHGVLLGGGSGSASKLPWIALGLAWALVVLALLGPSWQRVEESRQRPADPLVILLELTPQMLAEDSPPNRLEQARRKVLDLLEHRRDSQTALVVYAGSAHTWCRCPMTWPPPATCWSPSTRRSCQNPASAPTWPCKGPGPAGPEWPGPRPLAADRLVAERPGTPRHQPGTRPPGPEPADAGHRQPRRRPGTPGQRRIPQGRPGRNLAASAGQRQPQGLHQRHWRALPACPHRRPRPARPGPVRQPPHRAQLTARPCNWTAGPTRVTGC